MLAGRLLPVPCTPGDPHLQVFLELLQVGCLPHLHLLTTGAQHTRPNLGQPTAQQSRASTTQHSMTWHSTSQHDIHVPSSCRLTICRTKVLLCSADHWSNTAADLMVPWPGCWYAHQTPSCPAELAVWLTLHYARVLVRCVLLAAC